MLKNFKYTKKDGSESIRNVYPIGVQDDKLFAIDLTGFDDIEQNHLGTELELIHKEYIDKIKDLMGSSYFRLFFFDGIS